MTRVAIAQLQSKCSISENIADLVSYLKQTVDLGAQLIVLPENFAFMGKNEMDKLAIAEDYGNGFIQDNLSAFSQKFNVWIIAGTIPLKSSENQVTASCLVYNNNGECVKRYDKIHLFDVTISNKESHFESKTIKAGASVEVIKTPIGCIGLSVCYDIRFPELYRQLLLKGAEIFTVPSAFTMTTGRAHWQVLLRARAIENLCYVLAPNQWGKHENGRKTYGHSMIINPWGKIIKEIKKGCGLIVADIDLHYLKELRKQFPCNDHHRL